MIETIPKNSEIYLNNKLIKTKTPSRINYLLPDDYNVEIKKQGYFSWKNMAHIDSNSVTFLKDIYLVSQNPFTPIFSGEVISFQKIPDENLFILFQKNDEETLLILYDANDISQKTIASFTSESNPTFRGWSNNGRKLIIENAISRKVEYSVLNMDSLELTRIQGFAGQNFNNIQWDLANNTSLYGSTASGVYQIDFSRQKFLSVLKEPSIDYIVYDGIIYYITKEKDGLLVKRKSVSSDTPPKSVKLTDLNLYQIQFVSKNIIALSNPIEYEYFALNTAIFDSSNKNEIENNIIFEGKAKSVEWSKNKKKFLYFNDFELFTYDVILRSENLINRFSVPIRNAQWALNENSVIYQLDNSLYITDIHSSNGKNIYPISQGGRVDGYLLGNRLENFLWVQGSVNNVSGIFLYTLIPENDLPFFEQVLPPQEGY